MSYTFAQIKKTVASAIGGIATVIAALLTVGQVIPVAWLPYAIGFVAVAQTLGVFKAKNAPMPVAHRAKDDLAGEA